MAAPSFALKLPLNDELSMFASPLLKIAPPYPFAVLSSKSEFKTSNVPSL
jgi:hypothetical protein